MMCARTAALAACVLLSGGCALIGQRVRLCYSPSRNVTKAPRKSSLCPTTFVDKRADPARIGDVPLAGKAVALPLRPRGRVARWMELAAIEELKAAGYDVSDKGAWRFGGVIEKVHCGSGPAIACAIELDLWVKTKDGWPAVQRTYKGEGSRPALLPDDDPYELSLDEALRDALSTFRKDVELNVP